QLPHGPVVDAGPEVVRVADHRRPRRTADRGLHLALDAGQAALHDLNEYGIYCGVHGWLRRTIRLPRGSTVAVKPGGSGTVAPYSSITAGPSTVDPAGNEGRQYVGVSSKVPSKQTGRLPLLCRGPVVAAPDSAGRRIGPMPVTRRFTHSTCCSG